LKKIIPDIGYFKFPETRWEQSEKIRR